MDRLGGVEEELHERVDVLRVRVAGRKDRFDVLGDGAERRLPQHGDVAVAGAAEEVDQRESRRVERAKALLSVRRPRGANEEQRAEKREQRVQRELRQLAQEIEQIRLRAEQKQEIQRYAQRGVQAAQRGGERDGLRAARGNRRSHEEREAVVEEGAARQRRIASVERLL